MDTNNTFHTKDTMQDKPCFYGSATVGTKGQIVIPQEARAHLGITPGDKLVIIGLKDHPVNMMGICPVGSIEALLGTLTKKLEVMRRVVNQTKKDK